MSHICTEPPFWGATGRSLSDHKLLTLMLSNLVPAVHSFDDFWTCFVVLFKQIVCQKVQSTMWDSLRCFFKKPVLTIRIVKTGYDMDGFP